MEAPVDGLLWSAAAAPLGGAQESADRVLAALLDGEVARRLAAPPDGLAAWAWHAEYRPDLHAGALFVTVQAPAAGECGAEVPTVESVLEAVASGGPTPEALSATVTWVASEQQRTVEVASALAERLAVDRALLGRWDVEASRLHALADLTDAALRARAREAATSPWRAAVVARAAAGESP